MGKNDKLLRRFYEPLLLLSVLDRTRGRQRPDFVVERGLQTRDKLWRNFLDQLSFLCDAEKGGDTVTAIAAEQTAEGTIFWLASNSDARAQAQDHVTWILSQLTGLYEANEEEAVQIQEDITKQCIKFGSRRIRTYGTLLVNDIEKIQRRGQVESSEDGRLLEGLEPLITYQNSPIDLCAYAYSLRSTETIQILSRRHVAHDARGLWSDIRHHIGRLGCWTKAVRVLVETAHVLSQHIEGARVCVVLPQGIVNPLPSRSSLDLEGIVRRMFPPDQPSTADEFLQLLQEFDLVSPWKTNFSTILNTFRPRPHAELLVLEHFVEQSREFTRGDRYIGCSKPSCYCCSLYMKVHPTRFEERACHGNLWPNWAPPIPLPNLDWTEQSGQQAIKPQEHPTFRLLQDMTALVRAELIEQVRSRRPRRNRIPDTSTGMSSVIINTSLVQMRQRSWPESAIDRVSTPIVYVQSDEPRDEASDTDIDEDTIVFTGRRSR